MAEGLVYSLYSFLAFAEVAVLLASGIAFFAFVAWQIIRKVHRFVDAAANVELPVKESLEPSIKTLNPLGVAAGKRTRPIPGGHNERF